MRNFPTSLVIVLSAYSIRLVQLHGAVTLLSLLPEESGDTFALNIEPLFRDGDELRPTPQG